METLDEIRARLHGDPVWCVYALGDLDPRRRHYCTWHTRGPSVALVYREFDTPILFAAGSPDVLAEVPDLDACLIQLPDTFREPVARRFVIDWEQSMYRMWFDGTHRGAPAVETGVVPLGPSDEADLRVLYADGIAAHEEPDFFMASQLGDGTFFGIRRDGHLVAAGGTHLFAPAERVAAIGNVYTHRTHRGHGYGAAVVAAIVRRLAECGTRTIALNVKVDNPVAIRLYQRLGFRIHSSFLEGRAVRRQTS